MDYDELLKARRIRRHKASREEIRQALDLARRDLQTARMLLNQDWDWSFAVAYNAVLQACRAYMFAKGFRPESHESHKNTFAFMQVAIGSEYADLITYFDRMRAKRNQTIYDMAGAITETEAKNILEKAESFVEVVTEEIDKAK